MTERDPPVRESKVDTIGWIAIIVAVIMLIVWVDARDGSGPPSNNEPYVGHCNRPTAQAGC